jgi:hypothetical protein
MLDQATLISPLVTAISVDLPVLGHITLADEPPLLRPPLVLLSVWRC